MSAAASLEKAGSGKQATEHCAAKEERAGAYRERLPPSICILANSSRSCQADFRLVRMPSHLNLARLTFMATLLQDNDMGGGGQGWEGGRGVGGEGGGRGEGGRWSTSCTARVRV